MAFLDTKQEVEVIHSWPHHLMQVPLIFDGLDENKRLQQFFWIFDPLRLLKFLAGISTDQYDKWKKRLYPNTSF